MSGVRKTAKALADAIKEELPNAGVGVVHHKNTAGKSSYVHVSGHRFYAGARVSDHAIGMKRLNESAISLYLRPNDKPSDWSIWLGGVVKSWNEKVQCKETEQR